MGGAQAMTERLEGAFRAIEAARMEGVPILNRNLNVEAVGMLPWQDELVCVLVTPWFMNLTILPGDEGGEAWPGLRPGESVDRDLPAGTFSFLLGAEEGLGRFLSCSLFSPMFEFPDQDTAVATAAAALAEIMTAPAAPAVSRRALFTRQAQPAGDAA